MSKIPQEATVHISDDLYKRIMFAIFDPGAAEGLKGDRDLTTWQTDAVMRVLTDYDAARTAAPAPLEQAPPVTLDGPELWEIVFRVLKGNVPDQLTDEAFAQIAKDISEIGYMPAPSQPDKAEGGV